MKRPRAQFFDPFAVSLFLHRCNKNDDIRMRVMYVCVRWNRQPSTTLHNKSVDAFPQGKFQLFKGRLRATPDIDSPIPLFLCPKVLVNYTRRCENMTVWFIDYTRFVLFSFLRTAPFLFSRLGCCCCCCFCCSILCHCLLG